MAEYWWRENAESPAQGPVDAQRLRELAAAGQLTPDAQVSQDTLTWHRAADVKNLFPTTSAPAGPTVSQPPPFPVSPQMQPVPPAPMPYYSHAAYPEEGTPGTPRNLMWFLICGIVVGILGAAVVVVAMIQGVRDAQAISAASGPRPPLVPPPGTSEADPVLGVGYCFTGIIALVMFIYWLVWVYKVHDEIRRYTGGRHSVSPGQALGFSFIPLFNLFWNIYMPYQLAVTVQNLKGGQGRPSPGLVMALQIMAIIPGCCIYGLAPLFMAIVAYNIQEGLNDLWRHGPAVAQPANPYLR